MFQYYQNHITSIQICFRKKQACLSLCSALEKYTENGNIKSRHYLAKKEILNSLLHLVVLVYNAQRNVIFFQVGQGFGTEKVLIALCKDDT